MGYWHTLKGRKFGTFSTESVLKGHLQLRFSVNFRISKSLKRNFPALIHATEIASFTIIWVFFLARE